MRSITVSASMLYGQRQTCTRIPSDGRVGVQRVDQSKEFILGGGGRQGRCEDAGDAGGARRRASCCATYTAEAGSPPTRITAKPGRRLPCTPRVPATLSWITARMVSAIAFAVENTLRSSKTTLKAKGVIFPEPLIRLKQKN